MPSKGLRMDNWQDNKAAPRGLPILVVLRKARKWCDTEEQSSDRETSGRIHTCNPQRVKVPMPREHDMKLDNLAVSKSNNRAATNTVVIARTATHYNTHIGCTVQMCRKRPVASPKMPGCPAFQLSA